MKRTTENTKSTFKSGTELEKKRESIFLKIWSTKMPPMFSILGNMKGDGSVKRGSKMMW